MNLRALPGEVSMSELIPRSTEALLEALELSKEI